jgi:hypothetical protein
VICTWAPFSGCDIELRVAPRVCISSSHGKKNFFSPSRGKVNGISIVGAVCNGCAFNIHRFKLIYPRVRVQCCTGLVNSNLYPYLCYALLSKELCGVKEDNGRPHGGKVGQGGSGPDGSREPQREAGHAGQSRWQQQ